MSSSSVYHFHSFSNALNVFILRVISLVLAKSSTKIFRVDELCGWMDEWMMRMDEC